MTAPAVVFILTFVIELLAMQTIIEFRFGESFEDAKKSLKFEVALSALMALIVAALVRLVTQ